MTGAIPGMGGDGEAPVFAEPWQAQAFAMTLRLHEQGCFSWPEWTAVFSRELKAGSGAPEDYYRCWLTALETIVAEKGLLEATELGERRDAWERAAKATPHGQPIVLGRDRV